MTGTEAGCITGALPGREPSPDHATAAAERPRTGERRPGRETAVVTGTAHGIGAAIADALRAAGADVHGVDKDQADLSAPADVAEFFAGVGPVDPGQLRRGRGRPGGSPPGAGHRRGLARGLRHLAQWATPPFGLTVDGPVLRGRGVSDDKGPVYLVLQTAQALLDAEGRLPLNVKFLIEGEEEIGSPHLPGYVTAHAPELAADLVISADGAMWRPVGFLAPQVAHDIAGGLGVGQRPGQLGDPRGDLASLRLADPERRDVALHDPSRAR
jgi:Peptidase family M20/M25/M40